MLTSESSILKYLWQQGSSSGCMPLPAKGHMRLKLGLFELALGTLLAFFSMFTYLLNYRQHKAVPRHFHPRTSCVPSHTPASCCACTVLTTHVGC
jgi:hypothetical protein